MAKVQINNTIVELTEEEEAAETQARSESVTAMLNVENRNTRNQLLADSDWTVLTDSPLTTAQKTKWKTYRASLRDLPASEDWPNVTFPEEPS